jgi:hypothetical protein
MVLMNRPLPRHVSSSPRYSRAVFDFYTAMNNCQLPGELHPVQARNSGILPAWIAWMQNVGGEEYATGWKELFENHRRRFFQNVANFEEEVVHDPAIQRGEVNIGSSQGQNIGPFVMSVAPLMFWIRPNVIIEATNALEDLLVHSDLGDDLPIGLVRPPFPACYIPFGKTFREVLGDKRRGLSGIATKLQGVYVFTAGREEDRALSFVLIEEIEGQPLLAASDVDLIIRDEEQSIHQIIANACRQDGQSTSFYETIVQLCTKNFLYMNLSQTVQLDDPSYTLALRQLKNYGPKKLAKRSRQIAHLYDRIVLGPQTLMQHATDEHGEVSPHMRRGHFRLQPHGPQQSLRKVIFIAPTWIRADRL